MKLINFSCLVFFVFYSMTSFADKSFFKDISNLLPDQKPRLSYGVAVTDFDKDGLDEFIVTGFGYENLALGFDGKSLKNKIKENIFSDFNRSTIGVAACDIDKDGHEEIYFLNTDTYSGQKMYSDRLLNIENKKIVDLFEKDINQDELNLTAGRSVVCVDREGKGNYGVYVANYGGPTRFYEYIDDRVVDLAVSLNLDEITGGRAVVAGHILTDQMDIFAANERGPNFLYFNKNGKFLDVAGQMNVRDIYQNGRGTALSDILYRGRLDILNGNWGGYHRAYVYEDYKFRDIAVSSFDEPSKIRTVISADFDNDGYDEVFLNNIGEPNRLYKIVENGVFKEIKLEQALEPNGLGTGAAVADIDNDGILELLISHGESGLQPLTLFKYNSDEKRSFLRVRPLNIHGAPARGATVTLYTNERTHSKTIDAGSGYLCQMEPVAHYGIRDNENEFKIKIKWTNGDEELLEVENLNQTIVVKQKI